MQLSYKIHLNYCRVFLQGFISGLYPSFDTEYLMQSIDEFERQ